jgi:hypothetical protein
MTTNTTALYWNIDSLPKEKRTSAILSTGSILALCLFSFLFLSKLKPSDPPLVNHLMVQDEILDEIPLEELFISDGGSAKGGGTPSMDERTDPMEQTERTVTDRGNEPIQNGNSNHTVGNNPTNPSSSPSRANNPFGDGGNGGGHGGGNGPFDGNGKGTGGDGDGEGDGFGDGKSRIRINDPLLPKYNTDVDLKIHLKLTVSGDGAVSTAVCIKSKTTTTDQTIINDVIRQVIRQVKYKKDPEGRPAICYVTIKVNPK